MTVQWLQWLCNDYNDFAMTTMTCNDCAMTYNDCAMTCNDCAMYND